MEAKTNKLFSLLAVLFFFVPVSAQHIKDQFNHITIEDGLSSNGVSCILEDSRGVMWFGTQDGLNRYDGCKVVVYNNYAKKSNQKNLPGNVIHVLYPDESGGFYVGTGSGLARYLIDKDQFEEVVLFDNDALPQHGKNITALMLKDSVFWVGTSEGFFLFDRIQNSWNFYLINDNKKADLFDNWITSFVRDTDGSVWIGTRAGLVRFFREEEKFLKYTHDKNNTGSISHNRVQALLLDSDGTLWVGTWAGGLNRFDRKTETFKRYTKHQPGGLRDNQVESLAEDHSGQIWIGTWHGGINILNPETGQIQFITSNEFDPFSLNSTGIWTLYKDRHDNIWAGTTQGGVNVWFRHQKPFSRHLPNPLSENTLSGKSITAILEDSAEDLWVGTYANGVNIFDNDLFIYIQLKHNPENVNSISDDHISCMLEDYRKNMHDIWVGTLNGLNRYNKKTGEITRFFSNPDNPESLSDNIIYQLVQQDSVLWIATSNGLNRLNLDNGRIRRYMPDYLDNSGLMDKNIWALALDGQSRLWVGTAGGLHVYNPERNSFLHLFADSQDLNRLTDEKISSLYCDKAGHIWVGTWNGLNVFNPDRGGEITHFTESDGLPSGMIQSIMEDDRGFMWLATRKGMVKLDPYTKDMLLFDKKDGLPGIDFMRNSVFKNKNEKMYFGSSSGFTAFFPEKIEMNPVIPKIFISDVRINNQSVPVSRFYSAIVSENESVKEAVPLRLAPSERIISFEFAALNYMAAAKNRYKYKMEGYDNQWHKSPDFRTAAYMNLAPGRYVFYVTGSNNDQIWNETGTAILIQIVPFWWQTTLFKIAAFAFLTGFIYIIYYVRTKRINKINLMLKENNLHLFNEIEKRQKTEAALQQSERKYRTLFSHIADPVVLYKKSNNEIMDFNESMVEKYGYSSDELLKMKVEKLYLDKGVGGNNKDSKKMDYKLSFINRHVCKNGELLWIETHSAIIEFEREEAVLSILRDVTERKEIEEKLSFERNLFRSFFDNTPNPIYFKDINSQYIAANKAMSKITGIDIQNIAGKSDFDIYTKNEAEQSLDVEKNIIATGKTIRKEEKLTTIAGTRWFYTTKAARKDSSGEIIGTFGISWDITSQKEDQEKLKELANRLKIFHEIDKGIIKSESPAAIAQAAMAHISELIPCTSAMIATFNDEEKTAAILAHYSAAGNVLKSKKIVPIEAFVTPEYLQKKRGIFNFKLDNEKTHLIWLNKHFIKEKITSYTVAPLLIKNRVVGAIFFGHNEKTQLSSQQRRIVKELSGSLAVAIHQAMLDEKIRRHADELDQRVKERTSQLEAANRELESFAYSVSHDLRAPLRSIDGFSKALEEDYTEKLDEEGRDFIQRVRKASQRMGSLIDDILSLSRVTRSALKIESVNLGGCAWKLINQYREENSEIKARFTVEENLFIKADRRLLEVMLNNLIGNAIKFSFRKSDPHIIIGTLKPDKENKTAVYYVKDNGVGFNMAYKNKLFGAFQRLHAEREFEGSGVGLATVQRIINRHGGRVWAESEEGKGAVFYFIMNEK